jgi:hypothetical protein
VNGTPSRPEAVIGAAHGRKDEVVSFAKGQAHRLPEANPTEDGSIRGLAKYKLASVAAIPFGARLAGNADGHEKRPEGHDDVVARNVATRHATALESNHHLSLRLLQSDHHVLGDRVAEQDARETSACDATDHGVGAGAGRRTSTDASARRTAPSLSTSRACSGSTARKASGGIVALFLSDDYASSPVDGGSAVVPARRPPHARP